MIENKLKKYPWFLLWEAVHLPHFGREVKNKLGCVYSTFKICVDAKEIKFSAIWIRVLRNCSCLVINLKIVFDRRCAQKEPQDMHEPSLSLHVVAIS